MGGFIQCDRVNGMLAVSRAFGNIKIACINAEPEVVQYKFEGKEDFLVLACDGLTDVMTFPQIHSFVRARIEAGVPYHSMSECLVVEALTLGSTDNVTVIVVPFSNAAAQTKTKISKITESTESEIESDGQKLSAAALAMREECLLPESLSEPSLLQLMANSEHENKST